MATRWGIISAGKICNDFVSSISSLPASEHQVVAVGARNLEDAIRFAELHKIPKATSYQGVIEDPDVDVVYVGSINPQHLPVGEQVLRAGKALLVEKPMGLNHRQTEQLVTLARSQGVFLMEALWSRFLPAYSHLRQEISRGAVGEVSHVEASFGFPMEVERLSRKDMGGSTILDIGIYTLNAVCMAYGDLSPEKVVALGNLNSEGVDESMTASLKFGPRQLASISTSAYCKLPCDLVVTGTCGQLKLLDPFWCPTKLQLPSGEILEFPMPEPSRPCNYINSGGLRYQAQEVRRCLQQGLIESPAMSHRYSLQLAALMDELRHQLGVEFPQDKP